MVEPPGSSTSLVVMGVSGSGKTTLAQALVRRLGWVYAEGDDFHPAENVAKMHSGRPLNDDDRWPWLRSLAGWVGEHEAARQNVIITCSALKHSYREVLREGHPSVWFAHVAVPYEVLRSRLEQRQGHYMPASLLDSQLATLEPLRPDEPGITIPGDADPSTIVENLLDVLRSQHRVTPWTLEQAP